MFRNYLTTAFRNIFKKKGYSLLNIFGLTMFAYRISIHWWVFIIAAMIAVLIAFLTISTQAMKAALTNPVKSLRTE
jgi:hypothetical protein